MAVAPRPMKKCGKCKPQKCLENIVKTPRIQRFLVLNLVAEERLEPPTSGLWAHCKNLINIYVIRLFLYILMQIPNFSCYFVIYHYISFYINCPRIVPENHICYIEYKFQIYHVTIISAIPLLFSSYKYLNSFLYICQEPGYLWVLWTIEAHGLRLVGLRDLYRLREAISLACMPEL